MSDKSDTPRTDALLREFQPADSQRELDLARLARQLELALAASQSRCAEIERETIERCKRACESERLHENTGIEGDISYEHAIDDCVRAIDALLATGGGKEK